MPRIAVNYECEFREFWLSCGLASDAWPGALQSYEHYYRLILAHNAAAGLMGQVTLDDFYIKHLSDSLSVLLAWPGIFSGEIRLADVGCGAGLPGIVLAVALPDLRLTAIESNQKKAAFVEMAAAELGLSGRVEVAARRSRELGHIDRYRGRFDVITARAVAPAEKIIRENRMLLAPACREQSRTAGSLILYKTPAAVAAELPLARRQADKHKLTVETSDPIALPAEAGMRQFIRALSPVR